MFLYIHCTTCTFDSRQDLFENKIESIFSSRPFPFLICIFYIFQEHHYLKYFQSFIFAILMQVFLKGLSKGGTYLTFPTTISYFGSGHQKKTRPFDNPGISILKIRSWKLSLIYNEVMRAKRGTFYNVYSNISLYQLKFVQNLQHMVVEIIC